jgi:hypothetical protein
MTSLERESGRPQSLERFRETMAAEFARAFARRGRAVSPAQLAAALGAPVAG